VRGTFNGSNPFPCISFSLKGKRHALEKGKDRIGKLEKEKGKV